MLTTIGAEDGMQAMRALAKLGKPILSRTIYRPGQIARIWFGPCKGLSYRIFPGWGLAHLYGGFEPELHRTTIENVHAGSVVYDLGANYGLHTLLFARLAGPTGRVFSFEPMPRIRDALIENVGLNGFDNVTVVPLAVSDHVGRETFLTSKHDGAGHIQSGGRGNNSDAEAGASFDVSLTTLDRFVAEGNPPPTFIKIDIEGAEGAALRGASEVLAKHRPTLLIELHTPDQDLQVGRELSAHGYTATRIETGERVADLSIGWPNPDGLWGTVLARPAS